MIARPTPSPGQHRFNSLHAFCRLRDCRIPRRVARTLALVWERFTRWAFYVEGR